MLEIAPERPQDAAPIEQLLDQVFGSDREQAKTVYRLRDGVPPLEALCFTAGEGGRLIGCLRFWPVAIGGRLPALLLGPVAVEPGCRGRGVGARLIGHGLDAARARGHRVVVLVGDEGYYRRFGFRRRLARALDLPGPYARRRLLAAELEPGALRGVAGRLAPRRCLRERGTGTPAGTQARLPPRRCRSRCLPRDIRPDAQLYKAWLRTVATVP